MTRRHLLMAIAVAVLGTGTSQAQTHTTYHGFSFTRALVTREYVEAYLAYRYAGSRYRVVSIWEERGPMQLSRAWVLGTVVYGVELALVPPSGPPSAPTGFKVQ